MISGWIWRLYKTVGTEGWHNSQVRCPFIGFIILSQDLYLANDIKFIADNESWHWLTIILIHYIVFTHVVTFKSKLRKSIWQPWILIKWYKCMIHLPLHSEDMSHSIIDLQWTKCNFYCCFIWMMHSRFFFQKLLTHGLSTWAVFQWDLELLSNFVTEINSVNVQMQCLVS